jgi:GWxTD domain-containing protein
LHKLPGRIQYLAIAALALATLFDAGPAAARGFVIHANAFMGHDRTPSVKLTAEIPFSSLVFLKEEDKYRARYSISVKIRDVNRDDEIVRTAVFEGDAVAPYYEDTHSREKRARPTKSFPLAPGEYSVEAVLAVKNTHIRYQRLTKVVVPDFLASGLGFGTPEVFFLPYARGYRVVRWDDFDKRADLKRSDSEMVGLNVLDSQPAVRFELYLSDALQAPLVCSVAYEVRDAEQKRVLYGRSRVRIAGQEDVFLLLFDAEDWRPGAYTINLQVAAEGGKLDARSAVRLDLDVTRAMLADYFEDTLEILSLIAASGELQSLETASPEMREEEWRKFWQRRDPDPSTADNEALEELLNRVRTASSRYSKFGHAWRTDRGKVYIRYGEPDKVEQTADRMNRGEYEVWTYVAQGRTFVFYAQYSGGEYRLVEGDTL